jgi:NADH:ubiquinone oxidoreductase subunit F (NADH-binding)
VGLQNIRKELLRQKQRFWKKNILGSGFDLELYVHIGAVLTFVEKTR